MLKLNEWIERDNKPVILEAGASLSRVLNKLEGDIDFGIITAFRKYDSDNNKISIKENQRKNNELLKYLRSVLGDSKAYGAYKLLGHWKECSVELPDGVTIADCALHGGTIEDSLEESWLIINDKNNEDFFDALQTTARKYNQDAFVARIKGDFGLFGKDGTKWEGFGKISSDSISNGFKKVIGLQGYSELKKRRIKGDMFPIVFDGIKESITFEGLEIPKETNSSKMLFKYANILYK